MHTKLNTFFLSCLTFAICSLGQAQNINDSSIDVMPHWQKRDVHNIEIKSTATQSANSISQSHVSSFRARFAVLELSDSSYTTEWVYTSAKLGADDPTVQDLILAKLLNHKIIVKLSATGKFEELVNFDEVRSVVDKVVDGLIASSTADKQINGEFRAIKQVISSRQGLENVLLKHIKFYVFSFGYNYTLNLTDKNHVKFPNPVNGQLFDAMETVTLTKLDKKDSVCIIESAKIVDARILKNAIVEFYKKASKEDSKEIDDQVGKANIEMSEKTMQQIDFAKGLVQKSWFKQTLRLGFQSGSEVLEISTAN